MDKNGSWPRDALPKATQINGYRIEAVIGRGGFGITYRAIDGIDQVFAIKEYFPRDFAHREAMQVLPKDEESAAPFSDCLDRFAQEARALRRLADLGSAGEDVVRVVTFFQANGTAYMVMEFVEGESLDVAIKAAKTGLSAPQLDFIVPRLLRAVGCVHSAKLLHRDIKPGNIMLRPDSRPVLIDFGAARAFSLGQPKAFSILYSPGYAPYEQRVGLDQGEFSDIYALGATLYRAIGGDVIDSVKRHAALASGQPDPQPPAADIGKRRYASALLAAIDAALIVWPDERPQSVADLVAVMEREDREATVKPATDPVSENTVKPPGAAAPRRGLAIAACLLLTAAALAAGVRVLVPTKVEPDPSKSPLPLAGEEGAQPKRAGKVRAGAAQEPASSPADPTQTSQPPASHPEAQADAAATNAAAEHAQAAAATPQPPAPLATPGHPGWLRLDGGCFVWDPNPQPAETATWSGACQPNQPIEGQGTRTWFQSGKFSERDTGTFIDGKLSGHGVISWPDGSEFEGEFRDDAPNGYGTRKWPNGARYEGGWLGGNRSGHGVMVYADQGRYDGEWRDDKRNGHGVDVYSDGDRYDGYWLDDKRNGQGVMVYPDKSRYEGGWKNNEFSGHGVVAYSDGSRYDGNWVSGKKSGHGILVSPSGPRYDGEWQDDKKSGHGVIVWPGGNQYDGEFRNDLPNGVGDALNSGTHYYGVWTNGCLIKDGKTAEAAVVDLASCP